RAGALGPFPPALGLSASWSWDLPPGPAIVTACGAATALGAVGAAARHLTRRKAGIAGCGIAIVIGIPLVAFPQLDQPWLDALEDLVPVLQTRFLTSSERSTRAEAIEAIARGRAELARLKPLETDVHSSNAALDPTTALPLRPY